MSDMQLFSVLGISVLGIILAIIFDLTFNDPIHKADQERRKKEQIERDKK